MSDTAQNHVEMEMDGSLLEVSSQTEGYDVMASLNDEDLGQFE